MKKTRTCSSIHHLPGEIIYEILSTLPVADISQCRFVCRDWFKIIKNPDFVQLHHSKINQVNHTFLLASRDEAIFNPCYYLNPLDSFSFSTSASNFNLPPKKTMKQVTLVGSSNGLICLASRPAGFISGASDADYEKETFYICNPITKDTFKLPKITDIDTWYRPNSGFAYDGISDNYKVFRTFCYKKEFGSPIHTGLEIFTLGFKRWKRVEDISCSLACDLPVVLLNGALHWETCESKDSKYYNCIVAIDITTEKFKAFKQPLRQKALNMCTVAGKLCMIFDDFDRLGEAICLWIMKDYGSAESWTKKFIIDQALLGPFTNASFTIFETNKPELLMLVGNDGQGYYDLEKKEFRNIEIQGRFPPISPCYKLEFVIHLGSLVSPTAINRRGGYTKSEPMRQKKERKCKKDVL